MTASRWAGPIGIEGKMTGDGRFIEPGVLRWADLPLPLRWAASDIGAHDGAQVIGRIESIERREGGVIWAEGSFDLGSPEGQEAARQVTERITNGVSMDLDEVSFEIRVAAELLAPMEEGTVENPEPDEDGMVTLLEMESDDEVMVTTDARIRAATLVAIPAFAEARIEAVLDDAESDDQAEDGAAEGGASSDAESAVDAALVASARRREHPPREWFENPNLTAPTPLTVTEDGRVYGHLAAWGTCHVAQGHNGECITPPQSASGYAYFHVSQVTTDDGTSLPVGKLTVDTRHAGRKMNAVSTLAHYEDTGATAAFVRAGEDAFGIWVAGAINPDATPKQIRALRTSPLSGDWRRVNGGLELVAALSVNVPGFPIPRPSGLVASGEMVTLVASGMLPPSKVPRPGSANGFSEEDMVFLRAVAAREREAARMAARAAQAAALAARVRPARAAALAARVHRSVPSVTI